MNMLGGFRHPSLRRKAGRLDEPGEAGEFGPDQSGKLLRRVADRLVAFASQRVMDVRLAEDLHDLRTCV